MSVPRRFDLVVFDMDGVLTDSSSGHARAYADLWALIGVTTPPEYREISGRPTEPVVREYTRPLNPADEDIRRWVEFKQVRAREYLGRPAAFPDALPTISALAGEGFRMALGTSASRTTTEMLMSRAGLDRYFEVMVTGNDVARGKPAPDTFSEAISRAGGSPETSLVVEDSPAGLSAAVAAGAWALSVRTGETVEHPRFLGAHPDLTTLLPLLRSGS